MQLRKFGPLQARVTGGTDGAGAGDGPAVVLLHGFGAPGDDLVPLAGELDAPPGTRFVFPAAPIALQVMPGLMMDSRAWWNIDMERLQRALMTGALRDLTRDVPEGMASAHAQVVELLDAVERELGVDGDRLVLGGFSQGAMLSCDVALRSERKLAGLVLMSGTLLAEAEWGPRMASRRGMKVVQSHGTHDPILPFALAEQLRDRLIEGGFEHTWVPFMGQHQIPRDALTAVSALLQDVLTES